MSTPSSAFDPVAEMYYTLWNDWYLSSALPALDSMFFSRIAPGSSVLDVCCGCGHVTKEVVRRGFRVTGVDASSGLLAIARRELPDVDWRMEDVRHMNLEQRYAGALCTFDSLNHLLSLEDLESAFASVHRSLVPGGQFSFDMNLDEAYRTGPQHWVVENKETTVSLIRGNYDADTKYVTTDLTWFVREPEGDLWRRYHSVIRQRSYSQNEILNAITGAGFSDIEAIPAEEAGMKDGLGIGRLFVSARA